MDFELPQETEQPPTMRAEIIDVINQYTGQVYLGDGIIEEDFMTPEHLVVLKHAHFARSVGFSAIAPLVRGFEWAQTHRPNQYELHVVSRNPRNFSDGPVHSLISIGLSAFKPNTIIQYGDFMLQNDEHGIVQNYKYHTLDSQEDYIPREALLALRRVDHYCKIPRESASKSDFRTLAERQKQSSTARNLRIFTYKHLDNPSATSIESLRYRGILRLFGLRYEDGLYDNPEKPGSESEFVHFALADKITGEYDELISRISNGSKADTFTRHFKGKTKTFSKFYSNLDVLMNRLDEEHTKSALSGADFVDLARLQTMQDIAHSALNENAKRKF